MSDKKNQLVLAALLRAGKPSGSEDLLDAAIGLATSENWTPEHLADFNRRSIAKRLQNLEEQGLVKQAGAGLDARARRTTPLYTPVGDWNPRAAVPPPPFATADGGRVGQRAHAMMDRTQLLALLDAQDDLLGVMHRFLSDLQAARERHRARLAAVGLEVR